jgi:hypothetical protein
VARAAFAAVGTTGVLQYLTPLRVVYWLYVFQRLYYVPIVLGGLSMGRRGGLCNLNRNLANWEA